MTDAQKFKFYFPAWNEAVRANAWHVENKRLVVDESRLTEEGRKVLALARQRAAMDARPLKLDDMRHAAHIFALGKDKSSEHLTNREIDHVVTLFNLLADSDDLDARMKWDAYQRGEDPGDVKRIDWAIRNAAPEAYVRKVAADMIGTRSWEFAGLDQKRVLMRRLAQAKKSFRGRMNAAPRQLDPENEPF